MTVAELIAILQTKDPLCTVVLRDEGTEAGYIRVQSVEGVTMRAYARKGMLFLGPYDSVDMLADDGKTDVFDGVELGVLLSSEN